jgi:hypothetical protein
LGLTRGCEHFALDVASQTYNVKHVIALLEELQRSASLAWVAEGIDATTRADKLRWRA